MTQSHWPALQIADIRYTSKADFAGSALHILHRGAINIVYIATAQATGLKLLLKAYDISEQPPITTTLVLVDLTLLTSVDTALPMAVRESSAGFCTASWATPDLPNRPTPTLSSSLDCTYVLTEAIHWDREPLSCPATRLL